MKTLKTSDKSAFQLGEAFIRMGKAADRAGVAFERLKEVADKIKPPKKK